jgi:hypothetical protein
VREGVSPPLVTRPSLGRTVPPRAVVCVHSVTRGAVSRRLSTTPGGGSASPSTRSDGVASRGARASCACSGAGWALEPAGTESSVVLWLTHAGSSSEREARPDCWTAYVPACCRSSRTQRRGDGAAAAARTRRRTSSARRQRAGYSRPALRGACAVATRTGRHRHARRRSRSGLAVMTTGAGHSLRQLHAPVRRAAAARGAEASGRRARTGRGHARRAPGLRRRRQIARPD